jgi:two-component system, OmpR family, phosphate regulon sensor histidine kinase PhoR
LIRGRFFWKLYAGYVAIVLATTLLVGGLVAWRLRREWLHETENDLRDKATLIAEIAAPELSAERLALPAVRESLQAHVGELGAESGSRVTIIAADGAVLADSESDPARMTNHLDRPEILAARSHGIGTSTRHSETLGTPMIYVAIPVKTDGAIVGYVRASIPVSRFDRQIGDVREPVLFGAILAAALALGLGVFMSWRVTAPLSSIAAGARAIAQGQFDERIAVSAHDEVGALAASFNTMRDELRSRMQTITMDKNRLVAILSSMIEGVVAVDRDERIVHINSVAAAMLQVDPAEASGKRIWEATRVREVNEALGEAMRRAAGADTEAILVGDAHDRTIQLYAAPLRDDQGGIAGAVVVLHDVTALRRLETVRREFVANVSHELKTPLTAVRGMVETLIDDEAIAPDKRRHFLSRIQDQTLRLSALVNDLLTLSRVESRETPLEQVPVDLREVASESARSFALEAEKRGLALDASLPAQPLIVLGDREALAQAINNLLDNAVKYTPSGGRISLVLAPEGGAARVEVRDTGIGIEPREQARIFERFYRVDKGRSRELGGTGLGLSIVRNVAHAHGGDVQVESAPGRGSVFRLRFPLIRSG